MLPLLLAIAFVAACGQPGGDDGSPLARPERMEAVPTNLVGLAWPRPGLLVVSNLDYDARVRHELIAVRLPRGETEFLEPPALHQCRGISLIRPTSTSDGRIVMWRTCFRGDSAADDVIRIVAVDPVTGASATTTSRLDINWLDVGALSYDPTMTRAIISRSIGICGTLAWLTDEGIEEASIPIEQDGGRFVIDEKLLTPNGCDGQPLADLPAWSPDGQTIAFFFSSAAIDAGQFDRAATPHSLYFMDPEKLEPVEKLQGVVEPRSPVWSPDSRLLAFGGTIDGEPGTWIYDTATGALTRFAGVHPLWLAWSPSGDRIAAVLPKNGDPAEDETELVLYDTANSLR